MPIKGVINCCKLKLFCKVEINSVFLSKILFSKFLHQVWFTSFRVDCAVNPITQNVLNTINVLDVLRRGETIGISPLANRRVQHTKYSAACHHLLNFIYSPSFEDFLCHENKKYLLELKEKLFMMTDRPSITGFSLVRDGNEEDPPLAEKLPKFSPLIEKN